MAAMIEVERLGKRYRLGGQHQAYRTLREDLMRAVLHPFSRRRARLEAESFWALRDVSLTVEQGAVMGLIGRNGAGKSTLLKILSRITKPTEGRARLCGRVGSLLEVGTGFHAELTGRENIYLAGTILGMRHAEVKRKFDAIVAFSEIEKFIDTPVKHYSSGMYVRLAFAVAAHLEPEILLVDEVLAVGDSMFQKKCLGKMGEVSRAGRTVVFVSHNMDSIKRLCGTALWLDGGTIRRLDRAEACVSEYLLAGLSGTGRVEFDPPVVPLNGMPVALTAAHVSGEDGTVKEQFSTAEPITVRIEWTLRERLYKPRIGFVLSTVEGQDVLTAMDAESWRAEWLEPGRYVSSCAVPGLLLNEGAFVLDFSGDVPGRFAWRPGRTGALLQFEVVDDMALPNKYYGEEGFRDARWPGVVLPPLRWTQDRIV